MTQRQENRLSRRALFRLVGLSGGAVALGTLSGCSLFGYDGGEGEQTENGASTEATTVEMRDIAFQPQSITVTPGATVEWVNRDGVDHTVTRDGDFDSGRIPPGGRYERTFENEGTYDYVCTFHPGMTGQVVVEASG